MFHLFVLDKPNLQSNEEEHDKFLESLLEFVCDVDDHYQHRHSLQGSQSVGFLDIMLLSYLSNCLELSDAKDIYEIAYPLECHNLYRVLNNILSKY